MKFDKQVFATLMLISQLGLSMVIPVLLCTYGGAWLEKKFSFPFITIGIVLGILAGARNVYVLLKEHLKKQKEAEDEEE